MRVVVIHHTKFVTTAVTAFVLCLFNGAAYAQETLELASVSAIAVEVDTGKTIFAKRADVVLPIASITKLMTALVVVESGASMDEYLKIEDWDAKQAKNAYSRIRIDSQAKRADLLRIALMSSENRAAYNLGVHYAGGVQGLVNAMNAKAVTLGMRDTHFADPTGLSTENKSSAQDLAKMMIAAHAHPDIQKFSTTRQHTVNFRKPRYRLGYGNTNPLLGSSRWQVSMTKTGYLTEAGRCLVMVTPIDGKPAAVVLLNSFGKRSPLGDAGRIRRWLQEGIKSKVATAAKAHEQRVSTALGL
ncbi:MAG: D-alanyl-D-alanine endopeptidase [Pseudomonadales bacterium]|nr:D-alanyl-D-alanine endopeptidase [Pseudomonadales bacterium]